MRVLVRTKEMSRQEWLKWRRKGIGGSDVSVIAGVNKFRSIYQLWKEKTGQLEPSEEQTDYAHFGTVLEPVVKAEFTKRTGLKVRAKHAILQSTEYPFMLADLDGVVNDNGELCIFEAKTASEYKAEEWEKGVPFEYILQVQHYMKVTGYGKAYVAAIVGGNKFFCHIVYRDEELIKYIVGLEKKFWEENVVGMIEPEADGSDATTAYLNREYKESNGNSIELPREALLCFEEYDRLSKKIDELSESKEAVCNKLKAFLKENESGYIDDRKISWKQIQTTRFDKKRFEKELPEVYREYISKSSYRRLSVA